MKGDSSEVRQACQSLPIPVPYPSEGEKEELPGREGSHEGTLAAAKREIRAESGLAGPV